MIVLPAVLLVCLITHPGTILAYLAANASSHFITTGLAQSSFSSSAENEANDDSGDGSGDVTTITAVASFSTHSTIHTSIASTKCMCPYM